MRGGLGLRRVVRHIGRETTFRGQRERFTHHPSGVFDGRPGGIGRFLIRDDHGSEQHLVTEPSSITVRPSQCVVIETPRAGCYGPHTERSAAAREEDTRSGKFLEAFMKTHYGVG